MTGKTDALNDALRRPWRKDPDAVWLYVRLLAACGPDDKWPLEEWRAKELLPSIREDSNATAGRINRAVRLLSSTGDIAGFTPPSNEEVESFLENEGLSSITASRFIAYCERRQWRKGRGRDRNWREWARLLNGKKQNKRKKE